MNLSESIRRLNGWFWQDIVWKIALQYMGALYDDFHLEHGLKRLSDSTNLWHAIQSTSCEYLAVLGKQICEEKGKIGTARSIWKDEATYYVNFEDPPLEFHQSVWQKNCFGDINPSPKKVLFYFDVEYYNNTDSTIALADQQLVYSKIEPIYWLIRETFLNLGVDHIALASGRGYNFVCAIPSESPVFNELLHIGNRIEPSLAGKQSYPVYKRNKPVSWQSEMSFHGAMRLVLFFAGLIIDEARRRSFGLPVELTDRGIQGISFDLSFLTRSIDTSVLSIAAMPYLKLHFQKRLDPHVTYNTPIPIRLIRARGHQENFPDFKKMIEVRNDYRQALDHFSGQVGFIPDGSSGLTNLIKLYRQSPLASFFQQMDSIDHDAYWDWWKTYRNYHTICKQFPHLAPIIYNPNPALLKPDNLNQLINDFLDAGWHPKHVGGFIRSIYEDSYKNWGNLFAKYDAAKWADGWVEIFGAQRYF